MVTLSTSTQSNPLWSPLVIYGARLIQRRLCRPQLLPKLETIETRGNADFVAPAKANAALANTAYYNIDFSLQNQLRLATGAAAPPRPPPPRPPSRRRRCRNSRRSTPVAATPRSTRTRCASAAAAAATSSSRNPSRPTRTRPRSSKSVHFVDTHIVDTVFLHSTWPDYDLSLTGTFWKGVFLAIFFSGRFLRNFWPLRPWKTVHHQL